MEPLKQGFNSVLSSAESTFAKLVETTKKRDTAPSDGNSASTKELKRSTTNEFLENIQTKSSSFFSNVSSFIKRYQPQQTPATASENANAASTAADIGIVAEPQKTKMTNESSKDNI